MKPNDLVKTSAPTSVHLNVRMTGDDAAIWRELIRLTPGLTDSQRARDAIRLCLHAVLTNDPTIKALNILRQGKP